MPQTPLTPSCFKTRLLALTLAALGLVQLARAELPPFELNKDRIKVSSFGGSLKSSKTFLVPTATIMVSASGSVWAQAKNGSANAQAHAKFYVKGLDKALLQNLARQVQDDLVTKLRAAGYTVLTYDDVRDRPDWVVRQLRTALSLRLAA